MEKRESNILWCFLLKTERVEMALTTALVTIIIFLEFILHVIGINFVGYEEIAIIFAFWMYMIGSAYGSYDNSHIRADVLSVLMKDGIRKDIANLIEKTLTFLLSLVLLYWATKFFIWNTATGASTPAWRIPEWVGISSVIVGLVLMIFYNIFHLYDACNMFWRKYIMKNI